MGGRIQKVLVANRGEIAVRVMRTCRDLGIQSVAVFSKADRKALHVRYATEAYFIGPSKPAESYLNITKIIEIAKKAKVDAVHPGYGFLSENAEFAKQLQEAGIQFIGPSSESMMAMGNKVQARKVMVEAGVPVVPGFECEGLSIEVVSEKCHALGFPVMLKAASGGGGVGMRKVDNEAQIESAMAAAKRTALSAFGDDNVYVEKFLCKPRHIEMQVMADTFGNVRVFPERECSVQRRHQKVIEESPSPFVDMALRKKMADVAISAARAVTYRGAGTIEFLVDDKANFYFMEMNTRLQVEHPVTEMVSGEDLVSMQIAVANGEEIVTQEQDLVPKGWAMEARICAEDPEKDFMPTPGKVKHIRVPGGPFIRTDTGIYSGSNIPVEYDSMIAKIISWGPSRDQARKRLDRALAEFTIIGCTTNGSFLRQLLKNEEFASGDYDTGLVARFWDGKAAKSPKEYEDVALIGAAVYAFEKEERSRAKVSPKQNSARKTLSPWRQMPFFRRKLNSF